MWCPSWLAMAWTKDFGKNSAAMTGVPDFFKLLFDGGMGTKEIAKWSEIGVGSAHAVLKAA